MIWNARRWFAPLLASFVWACSSDETSSAPPAPSPIFDEQAAARLQEQTDAIVAQWHSPGTAVAAIDAQGAMWVGSSGLWDPVAQISLDPTHVSKAGSITKTLVAAVVLQLVEEQVVSLDDPLSRWFDGLPDGDAISLRDLLRHSSGLPECLEYLGSASEYMRPWEAADLVALIATEPRLFAPGEEHSYSNTNYLLLGLVIDGATGSTWRMEVEERLLEPLALEATTLPTDDWGTVGPGHLVLADGSLYEPATPNELRDVMHPSVLDAAGVMVADVADLARWGEALWGSDEVLTADSRAQQLDDSLPAGGGYSYGLGAVEVQDGWGRQLFHNGAVTGYVAWLGYRPEQRVTLAVLSNAWTWHEGEPRPNWMVLAADSLWQAWLSE